MATQTEAPAWPLPLGHYFGPSALEGRDLRCHSGREDWLHRTKLEVWQRHFREVWDRSLEVTGVYDAGTQDAVERVQQAGGGEPTGRLDETVWRAVWETRPKPQPARKAGARSAFAKPMKGK